MAHYLVRDAASLARALLALPAGLLPRRRWAAFDSLPVERMAGVSAVATLAVGFAVGVAGFLSFVQQASDGITEAALKAALRQAANPRGSDTVSMLPAMMASGLSPIAFFLVTPAGWLTIYLGVTGVVRGLAAWFGDPAGDPLIAGVDHLVLRGRARARERRARLTRERAEGPETPDRLYPAAWAGVDDAELVVVSSRQKPGWTKGTFVVTSDRWYTLGSSFPLALPEGLRTVYPLTAHRTGEVLRRSVPYELPPLQAAARSARRPGAPDGA